MKKLKSSLINMLLSLGLISIAAATLLAFVNEKTSEPIRLAEIAKQENAIREVAPEYDNSPVQEAVKVAIASGDSLVCYPARLNGQLQGVAVESSSDGFGGKVRIMVGFLSDGSIKGYSVLAQSETPGLGTKMVQWFKTDKNRQSILGLNPSHDNMTVSKDGGDVDAITAATISSRAFLLAVNRAYEAFCAMNGQTAADAYSGATGMSEETVPADTLQVVNP